MSTVEPPITDPPSNGHPPYNGRMVGTDRYSHINSAFLPSEIRTSLTDKPLNYGRRTRSRTSLAGQPLHTRRKGLASCLYATCSCCTVQCSPIRFVHVILNYAMFNYNIPYDRDRGYNRALRSIPYTQQPIKI